MDFNLKLTVLFAGIILTGMTAGLCFTWTNAVTPGIGKLDNFTFLSSFQSMNRVIENPIFFLVFFGPGALLFWNAWLHRDHSNFTFWIFALAAIIYFVGVIAITIFGNVPLNELLHQADLKSLSETDLSELRKRFENPWNTWHDRRTMLSLLSFILLLVGFLNSKL